MKHGPDDVAVEAWASAYATADEAMQRLKVRRQTLYAYVSRGWIRSIRQPGLKHRLYLRDDIERVGARSQARTGHAAAAASAMNMGDPIVTTGITEISAAGPSYRGHLATRLATDGYSFEATCELLWTGTLQGPRMQWPVRTAALFPETLVAAPAGRPAQLIDAFAMVTLRLGSSVVQVDSEPGDALEFARDLVRALVVHLGAWRGVDGARVQADGSVAGGVIRGLALADTQVHREIVDHVMVVLADHELAPGTLVARVAASGGATLHHCVASALCASSGSQVAQLYSRVDQLLAGAASKSVLMRRAAKLQQRGMLIPGFTHYLYPKGDPRARSLFELARTHLPLTAELAATLSFVDAMESEMGLFARHELALVAICRALALPDGIPSALLAIARTAGWVAHVREQRCSNVLLRPRARFESLAGDVPVRPGSAPVRGRSLIPGES